MPIVAVSQLKYGEKLRNNVLTKLGNTLFYKGKIVSERDIDILKAFLIQSVFIEGKATLENEDAAEQGKADAAIIHPFYLEYHNTISLLKHVFSMVSGGGQNIPVFDIRTQLERLIQNMEPYKVLTFSPKNMVLSDYIYHKSIMVSLTSYLLANWNGMPQKDLMQIALAGLLHDIGNAKVDPVILKKTTKLNELELKEVKQHPILGYAIFKNVAALNEGAKLCALQHHEREDGSGYPVGVSGDKIHSYAKVVMIADIFHAMTNQRFYKTATSPYLVLEQLFTESFGKVDPTLVQVFINKATQFSNGTLVKLSDNRVGEIVFSDRAHPTRPWVNLNGTIVNLAIERSLFIKEVIGAV